MLDPKRFWAEPPGARPGQPGMQLGPEQATYMQVMQLLAGAGPAAGPGQIDALQERLQAQLPADAPEDMRRQMNEWLSQLASHRAPSAGGPDAALGDMWPGGPAVTDGQIAAWEKKYRVKLPKLFREVFRQQNGGGVRDSEVCVLALGGIRPVDGGELYEGEFRDPRLVFEFASDGGEGCYLLDYNARGPGAEPAVYLEFRDCGELNRVADSVDELFRELLKSSDGPEVDWAEAERRTALARESLDLTAHYQGVPASLEQVLSRDGGALVLFVRRRVGDEETRTRTVLPEPLSAGPGLGAASVQPVQPGRTDLWTLNLSPRDPDGIVQTESTRTSTGRWKNRTSQGVPLCESVWSADPARLRKLRAELLGPERAARVEEEETAQQQLQARLDALSPAAQRAAHLEMVRQAMAQGDRLFQEQNPGIGEPPPELAAMLALVQGRLREVQRRAEDQAAQQPLDPELRKLIERATKPPRPDVDD